MDEASTVHRRAFDERLPWLAGLHSAAEDLSYFRCHVFETCALWGAQCDGAIVGILALRDDWIDHLYVLPEQQGRGVGTALLGIARREMSELSLWTFQRNRRARAFYERQGFVAVEQTDGAGNGEHEPDVRYHWVRQRRPVPPTAQRSRAVLSLRSSG